MKRVACLFVGFGIVAAPAIQATPALPLINTNNVVLVTSAPYNAVADGATDNTAALQNAINAAAASGSTNGLSGGTVEIPAGANAYLCGPLLLKSCVNLQIDSGAILRMLPINQYPGGTNNPANFISGNSLHDLEISGSGAIDGQGSPWWAVYKTANRPSMISLSSCNRLLIQNVTLSNSPMFHISIGGKAGNTTVQGVIVRAPASTDPVNPSHNTDACDVSGTNILVQNCDISTGDDDFTCGGGTSGVLLTNNTYGNGHGISIGSYTDNGGVSNITVINCTMNGTQNGIRIKSDNDRGGLVQNIFYYNISMTNVQMPVQIYSYYNSVGTPSSVSPITAAGETVASITTTTPFYRNITFSNITATSVTGYPIGIIWARTEAPATNIIFKNVKITGDRNFCLYNCNGVQFTDCNFKTSASTNTFTLFNAQATITNSNPTNLLFTFDGLATNGFNNALALYNAQGSLKNTNLLGIPNLTLSASTLTVSNNLNLASDALINFVLGSNATQLEVTGSLTLGGTNNFSAGPGFSNGSYTIMTSSGPPAGTAPVIGSTPAGYQCSYDTSVSGIVKLVAVSTNPSPPFAPASLTASATNSAVVLSWSPSATATNYNVKRSSFSGGPYSHLASVTNTNYSDMLVTNGTTYFYVVSGVNAGGEGADSAQASATPYSTAPVNLDARPTGNQLLLSWPLDHIGWTLQIQTNNPGTGLGTNWANVPGSNETNSIAIPFAPANGSVFLRLSIH